MPGNRCQGTSNADSSDADAGGAGIAQLKDVNAVPAKSANINLDGAGLGIASAQTTNSKQNKRRKTNSLALLFDPTSCVDTKSSSSLVQLLLL